MPLQGPRRGLARFLLGGLLLLVSPVAMAQPDPAEIELAKRHFELGRPYYDQAAYARALAAFTEAHRLSAKPALLYNIGKCHEAMGQLEAAIDYYDRFLSQSARPDANLSARIANLRKRLARKAAASRPPAPKPSPRARLVKQPVAKRPSGATQRSPLPPTRPAPASSGVSAGIDPGKADTRTDTAGRRAWMTWTGWGLVGVGGASIVSSFVFGALAKRKSDQVQDAYRQFNEQARQGHLWHDIEPFESKGEVFQGAQIVTLVVGIVAAGSGATLLLLRPKRESSRAQIVPQFGPRFAGVTLNGVIDF